MLLYLTNISVVFLTRYRRCPGMPQEGAWERHGRALGRRSRPGLDVVPRAQPRDSRGSFTFLVLLTFQCVDPPLRSASRPRAGEGRSARSPGLPPPVEEQEPASAWTSSPHHHHEWRRLWTPERRRRRLR